MDDLVKTVADAIEAEGAKLDEVEQMGKRQFAYNARKLDGGHYVNYTFEANAEQVEKIQTSLKLNKVVHLQHYQRLS